MNKPQTKIKQQDKQEILDALNAALDHCTSKSLLASQIKQAINKAKKIL